MLMIAAKAHRTRLTVVSVTLGFSLSVELSFLWDLVFQFDLVFLLILFFVFISCLFKKITKKALFSYFNKKIFEVI